MRYRNMFDDNGYHLFGFGQQRSLADGRVKLDREGKYSIHSRASGGTSIRRTPLWPAAAVQPKSPAFSTTSPRTRRQVLTGILRTTLLSYCVVF